MLVGGFGFIGRRFIKKYSRKYKIIVFGKKSSYQNFLKKNKYPNISFEIGDVTKNIEKSITKHKPDVVIHMAALTGISKCEHDPKKAFLVNVLGTYNVIKGCLKSNSKLIFISSREVYGDTKTKKVKEDDPLSPQNVYGVTKMLGENLIKLANEMHGMPFTILRITNVYGPEGDNYGPQVIIKNALKGKINVFGGTQMINFVYVDDVVKIISNTIQHKLSNNHVFNVGSPNTIKLKEFVDLVLHQIKNNVKVKNEKIPKTKYLDVTPDFKKLQDSPLKTTFKNIKSGIFETIEWYSN